jgi:PAS domain S-box-containing protein
MGNPDVSDVERANLMTRRKYCDHFIQRCDLDQIFNNSYDSIFVTDQVGNVLMANPAASRLLQTPTEEIVGANVNDLVRHGIYDRSTAMEAVEKREVVTGLIKTGHGLTIFSTSSPLFDENGNVTMVITNTRDKDLVEKFIEALEQERALTHRYKSAVTYLGDLDKDNEKLIIESPVMQKLFSKVDTIARVDSTVMILGESGTGKEVIARYIHRNSKRAKEPFIPVNCAAIPHDLMESEFFGYAKGAFTGANSQGKPGLFEIADKGTLFLDEIGDLPLPMQSKLLRALETSEVQRLGSTTSHRMDVRLLAATNRNLKQLVDQKLFREDLYYRLNVIPVYLPPLRERPEDILALAEKFLEDFNKKYLFKRYFSETTKQFFLQYLWPGNARELRNVIERLVITSPTDELILNGEFNLVYDEQKTQTLLQDNLTVQVPLKEFLREAEVKYIQKVLDECGGHACKAAKKLGIHRSVLYRKLHKDENLDAIVRP